MSDNYETAYDAALRYCKEAQDDILASIHANLSGIPDHDALNDCLFEEVDSSQAVIYTGRAWAYCFGSNSDGAYEKECGEAPATIERRAFYALEADIRSRPEWDQLCDAVQSHVEADAGDTDTDQGVL